MANCHIWIQPNLYHLKKETKKQYSVITRSRNRIDTIANFIISGFPKLLATANLLTYFPTLRGGGGGRLLRRSIYRQRQSVYRSTVHWSSKRREKSRRQHHVRTILLEFPWLLQYRSFFYISTPPLIVSSHSERLKERFGDRVAGIRRLGTATAIAATDINSVCEKLGNNLRFFSFDQEHCWELCP